MPTTLISAVRRYSYMLEGSIELPEWYDPELHKYDYCSCCCHVKMFRKDQNAEIDEPIWEDRIWFDEKITDVEHHFEDEKVIVKQVRGSG